MSERTEQAEVLELTAAASSPHVGRAARTPRLQPILIRCILLFAALGFASTLASADPLRAHVNHLAYRHRTGAPSMVDITLHYEGASLLRGRLLVDVVGLDALAHLETGEIALAGGDRPVRLMLPPIDIGVGLRTLELRLRFAAEDRIYDLDRHHLPLPERASRSLVVAIVDSTLSTVGSGKAELAQSLRLERFIPKEAGRGSVVTRPMMLLPEQLLAQPASMCCYDIIALTGEGFARLEQKQLDALRQWTQAGGSTLIFSDGAGLEARHMDFLEALSRGNERGWRFRLTTGGALETLAAPPTDACVPIHAELGRAMVVLAPRFSSDRLPSKDWHRSCGFLWRVHSGHLNTVLQGGVATLDTLKDDEPRAQPRPRDEVEFDPRGDPRLWMDRARQFDYSPRFDENVTEIVSTLMPRNIRVIPFSAVVWILLGFAVVIGPIDYFVLGMFRRRKFTWLSFPLLCIGFTALTVQVANRFMGGSDRGRTLVINDLGGDGRILRQTRIDLAFTGREVAVEHQVTGALYAPVSTFGANDFYDSMRYRGEAPRGDDSPPAYRGWLTGQHTVTRLARQWTPTIGRVTAIAPGREDAATIDWAAVEREVFPVRDGGEGTNATLQKLRAAIGTAANGASIVLLRSDGVHFGDLSLRSMFERPDHDRSHRYGYDYDRRDSKAEHVREGYVPSLLRELCESEQQGLSTIVQRLSPHGCGASEDLAMYCTLDASNWMGRVLLLVREQGDEIVVNRRLMVRRGP